MKEYYIYFRHNILKNYVRKMLEATDYETRKTLKKRIYSNVKLSENEKNEIWTEICKRCIKGGLL